MTNDAYTFKRHSTSFSLTVLNVLQLNYVVGKLTVKEGGK